MHKSRIVLISCVSQKLGHRAKAKDLYISSLFKKNLQYALTIRPDKVFILSAKYGLLELDDEIDTYDVTLNAMKSQEIVNWSRFVLSQLKAKTDFNNDVFIFLAGNKYRKYLLPHIKNFQIPMQGLGIGKQLQFLTNKLK
jgi:cytoplasmic iron level regulating protein YaaA (DUF328/UPF0246 family)